MVSMTQRKTSHLSTLLSAQIKDALLQYCKRRGLKISHFIEEAIREHLEDEADIEVYEDRRHEERILLKDLLKTVK